MIFLTYYDHIVLVLVPYKDLKFLIVQYTARGRPGAFIFDLLYVNTELFILYNSKLSDPEKYIQK